MVTIKELKKALKGIPDDWIVLARDFDGEELREIKIMARPPTEKKITALFG